jgi:D-alanyl-D-alanine carboxypeptidase/Putative peptidoglycan binding domain
MGLLASGCFRMLSQNCSAKQADMRAARGVSASGGQLEISLRLHHYHGRWSYLDRDSFRDTYKARAAIGGDQGGRLQPFGAAIVQQQGASMPFLLQRGGKNVPLEVQRWQYFLLKNKVTQTGAIDAQFGAKTEEATKIFQIQHALKTTGRLDQPTLDAAQGLGYTVKADNYYADKMTDAYPPRPANLASPSNKSRNAALGCFIFKQLPLANRADPDEIVTQGSCDGKVADWRKTNIVDVEIPQLQFAVGYSGSVRCHSLVAPRLVALFARWEELDLLHLIRAFDGAYVPRYIRGASPSPNGHGSKRSDQVGSLSNHSFGSAFDIDNGDDNGYGKVPVLCPQRGCTRELVGPANDLGFFWGGHFSGTTDRDGMHFEFAKF